MSGDATAIKEYAVLRKLLVDAGCFKRNPVLAMTMFTAYCVLVSVSITILFYTQNVWLVLLNAVFLAFLYGRFGLLAHDFGHQQVFATRKWNDFFGHVSGTIIGVSYSWWNNKHNAHHAQTNFDHGDPDIDLPILAYSEKQALEKKGIARFIVKHQAWFFFPIQLIAWASLRTSSLTFVLRERQRKDYQMSVLLTILHTVAYLGLVFSTQVWWLGFIFIIVHQKLWSAYITSIFAPNHKGMPILEGQSVDFMREQIMTARNIHPNWITNYYYGHLNLQIEHHLFPLMPRHHSGTARTIIRRFCAERGIDYHETSVIGSYIEIVKHMHEVSLCLR